MSDDRTEPRVYRYEDRENGPWCSDAECIRAAVDETLRPIRERRRARQKARLRAIEGEAPATLTKLDDLTAALSAENRRATFRVIDGEAAS